MSNNKPTKYTEEYFEFLGLNPETKRWISVIILFTLGILSILSFADLAGVVGSYFDLALSWLFGSLKYLFPIAIIILGYLLSRANKYFISSMNYFGLALLTLSLTAITHLYYPLDEALVQAQAGNGGGLIGVIFSYPLLKFTSLWSAIIILFALFLISILITFNTTFERLAEQSKLLSRPIRWILFPFKKMFGIIKNNKYTNGNAENEPEQLSCNKEIDGETETADEEYVEENINFIKKFIKNKKKNNIGGELIQSQMPLVRRQKIDLPIALLNNKINKPTAVDVESTKEKIIKTLENFGIEIEMGEYNVGPTVTQYTFRPADGVKLNRITSLNNDLSLALAAYPIRIEAPIPGKSLVGVEVPNQAVAVVNLREILESNEFKQRKSNLTVALGKDVKGKPWIANIDTMPHLLVAGATGSGKSVCVNSIIISLLYQNGPDDLKFIMVDPKRVELTIYNGIPHLITSVITDSKKTISALRWCLTEMDRRFDLLSKCEHRNIANHNGNSENKLPYIIFIIDELADLMSVAAADVEAAIIRLAQMSRAVGIHLILATQRPSVDVITGLIKANITTRIAFNVASLMDSRTILDTSGAEKLVGRGDMLYSCAELSKPKRLQGAYVSDDEIKKVVEYLKQQGAPDYTDAIVEQQMQKIEDPIVEFSQNGGDDDELLEEAKEIVIRAKKASASLLQRRLSIGYARAARLLDLMEEAGIVGPSQGAKPREIYVGEESLSIQQSYGEGLDNASDEMVEVEEDGNLTLSP